MTHPVTDIQLFERDGFPHGKWRGQYPDRAVARVMPNRRTTDVYHDIGRNRHAEHWRNVLVFGGGMGSGRLRRALRRRPGRG